MKSKKKLKFIKRMCERELVEWTTEMDSLAQEGRIFATGAIQAYESIIRMIQDKEL